MRVVVLAGESAGDRVVRRLAKSDVAIVGVIADPPAATAQTTSVWKTAKDLELETWTPEVVRDPAFANHLRSERVDLLLSVYAKAIVCDAVLEAPRLGSYNIHPGPLPEYAGVNPVSWALYRGERSHGVTAHRMTSQIDGGPIAFQVRFPISPEDSALSVMSKCVPQAVDLALRVIRAAQAGEIPGAEQDKGRRQYFGREVPHNGCVKWEESASQIVNFVRATQFQPFRSPWGHVRAVHRGQPIEILRARRSGERAKAAAGTIRGPAGTGAYVAAGDEWVIIERVVYEGRARDAASVLSPGEHLEDGV